MDGCGMGALSRLAERGGFEPPRGSHPNRFSNSPGLIRSHPTRAAAIRSPWSGPALYPEPSGAVRRRPGRMVTRVVTSLGDSSGLGLSFGPATMGRRRSPTILETFFGWIVFGLLILLVFSLVMLGITTAVHGNPALTALVFFGI